LNSDSSIVICLPVPPFTVARTPLVSPRSQLLTSAAGL
jgi:hypothetical protein